MCPRGRSRGQGRPRGLHLCYLMLKMLQKTTYHDFPDLGQVTKFNPKMQDFKRVLDLT